jgi:hypothetical protein
VQNTVRCLVAPLLLGMLWQHSFERHEKRRLDVDALCRAHLDLLFHGIASDPGQPRPTAKEARR